MLRATCGIAALTLGLSFAPSAGAQEPSTPEDADVITSAGEPVKPPKRAPSIVLERGLRVTWDPRWRKFDYIDGIIGGAGLAAAIGGLVIPTAPTRWVEVNPFDRAIRNGIRLDDLDDRNRARDASDITLALSINQLMIDTVIVTWWGHDNTEVALQMALMSAETIAINAGINGLVAAAASRQRPYATIDPESDAQSICVGPNNEDLRDCRSSRRYRSFYSGHTSTTFAVAGLTCMHHSHLPLYGGGWPDATACAGSFLIAAATGTLRVVADQHWGSDVLVGAAMGTFNGMFWPWLLHYRTGDLPAIDKNDALHWMVLPTPSGAQMVGRF